MKRFVGFMLEPDLRIQGEANRVTLTNDISIYRILGDSNVPPPLLERFFAYEKLNAYRKAILLRKLPPFAQLAVSEEMHARAMLPTNMAMTLFLPETKVEASGVITVLPMSGIEKQRVTQAIGNQVTR